ncbi:hypothetical protein QQS21_004175 [Conoideocrella luteorostrata]|uniref:N-acetylglutamate synthase n=1 Tax=Conoideocrella luteorostrata TaxID=1105319 RepID=A0AAJ0FUV7_9HYPO|nr:hypothetical protein QQS21_004175 [Conoideocrella luteorostrata]
MAFYDNKIFVSASNTPNGEVSRATRFHYHQNDNIVWAEYEGGSIVKGSLIARVVQDNCLEMRYHHINADGELMAGKCFSKPEVLEDGRVRLHEKWEWVVGDMSSGESVIEEVRD